MRSIEFEREGALADATAFFDDMRHDADVFEPSLAMFNGGNWQYVAPAIRRGRRGKGEAAK